MIKSILISMDESKSSQSALKAGTDLSKISGAKIKGLYVEDVKRLSEWQPVQLMRATVGVSKEGSGPRPTREQLEIEKEFKEEAKRLEKFFKENSKDTEGSFIVKRGEISEVITEVSRTVDLVVIGRRGKTHPPESPEPGPVTDNLLRTCARPVLVVPPGAKLTNRILVAYDGSRSSQRALSSAAEIAGLQKSEIIVVTIVDNSGDADKPLSEAKEFLLPYNLNVSYMVDFVSNKAASGIIKQAENFKAGLIALGAFGENKFLELIFGSTTRQVLMQAKCPVLLCN